MIANLIKNPSFEDVSPATRIWGQLGTTSGNTFVYDTVSPHIGSRCMKLGVTSLLGMSIINQSVSLIGGHTYTLKFYAKRITTDVWIRFFFDGICQDKPSLMSQIGSQYTQISQQFTVPNYGSSVSTEINIIAGSIAGTAWIDDVELMGDVAEPINPDADPYPNLLVNSGFEETNASWLLDSPAAIVSGNQHRGSKCLCFANRATGGTQAARQSVTIIPGNTYILYFYIKRSGNMGVWTSCEYKKADLTSGYQYTGNLLNNTGSDYSVHSLTINIPADASSNQVRIAINASGNAGETATAWVDRVELRGPKPENSSSNTVTYNRTAAIAYARQFTMGDPGSSCYNNDGFNIVDGEDCANYVSQCLFAGGVPQTDVWYYRTPYTSNGDRTAAWTGTVSMRNFLVARNWATEVSSTSNLEVGDLVFTYHAANDLPHVVIVTQDFSSLEDIHVCGHTSNQLDVVRESPAARPSVYYHINDTLPLQTGDVRYVGYYDAEDFNTAMSDYGKLSLTVGSTGTYVFNLQRRLKCLGYYTSDISGTYGPSTASAVQTFQTACGLTPSGIVDSNTKAKLYGPK